MPKVRLMGPGDMAQWLRAIAAFAEDPGSIPSTDTASQSFATSVP